MRLRLWRLGERTAKSQETPLATRCFTTVSRVPTTVLVALDLLDRIRLGFFNAVFIVPPAASWSRARHAEESRQSPLRTRSQPFGVVHAAPESQTRLEHENRSLDFVHWFAEQTLQCEVVRIPLVRRVPARQLILLWWAYLTTPQHVCEHVPMYGFLAPRFRGNQVEYRIAPLYGWGKAQGSFCTLWQRLLLCRFFFVLLVFCLSFLGIWRAFPGPAS